MSGSVIKENESGGLGLGLNGGVWVRNFSNYQVFASDSFGIVLFLFYSIHWESIW